MSKIRARIEKAWSTAHYSLCRIQGPHITEAVAGRELVQFSVAPPNHVAAEEFDEARRRWKIGIKILLIVKVLVGEKEAQSIKTHRFLFELLAARRNWKRNDLRYY